MANPNKKSKQNVDSPVEKKMSMKDIRQLRHLRNVEKKRETGSVFARARTKGLVSTKTEFRNSVRLERDFVQSVQGTHWVISQTECMERISRR